MNKVRALRSNMLLLISTLLLFAAWWSPAEAETVRGILHTNAMTGELAIVIKGRPAPLMVMPASPAVNLDLLKLKDGDLLVATANFQSSNALIVEAIESVGLADLLGRWKTQGSQVFEFQDFNRLNLYELRTELFAGDHISLSNKRAYNYVLAPDRDGRFSIFLSDDRSVHVGVLEIANGKVVITVFDPKTGAVSENITLSPLSIPGTRVLSI